MPLVASPAFPAQSAGQRYWETRAGEHRHVQLTAVPADAYENFAFVVSHPELVDQLWFKFGLKNARCIEKAGPQSKFCGREIADRVVGVAPIGAVRPNV